MCRCGHVRSQRKWKEQIPGLLQFHALPGCLATIRQDSHVLFAAPEQDWKCITQAIALFSHTRVFCSFPELVTGSPFSRSKNMTSKPLQF